MVAGGGGGVGGGVGGGGVVVPASDASPPVRPTRRSSRPAYSSRHIPPVPGRQNHGDLHPMVLNIQNREGNTRWVIHASIRPCISLRAGPVEPHEG